MNRTLKIIFFFSVALNILCLSFCTGHFLCKPHLKDMHRREKELVELLDLEHQEIAKQTFYELAELRKASTLAQKEKVKNLEATVIEKDFNKEKFLNQLTDLHKTSYATKKDSDEKLAKLLSQLSVNEREKIVKKIKKGLKHQLR